MLSLVLNLYVIIKIEKLVLDGFIYNISVGLYNVWIYLVFFKLLNYVIFMNYISW